MEMRAFVRKEAFSGDYVIVSMQRGEIKTGKTGKPLFLIKIQTVPPQFASSALAAVPRHLRARLPSLTQSSKSYRFAVTLSPFSLIKEPSAARW